MNYNYLWKYIKWRVIIKRVLLELIKKFPLYSFKFLQNAFYFKIIHFKIKSIIKNILSLLNTLKIKKKTVEINLKFIIYHKA